MNAHAIIKTFFDFINKFQIINQNRTFKFFDFFPTASEAKNTFKTEILSYERALSKDFNIILISSSTLFKIIVSLITLNYLLKGISKLQFSDRACDKFIEIVG